MTDMQDFLAKLRLDFVDEARYLLDQCEEYFLNLEEESSRADELAKIFRVAHTIKGSSATVGIEDLKDFAHAVEDLLSVLQINPIAVDQDVTSLLLQANDAMRNRIEMIGKPNSDEWDVSFLKQKVRKFCSRLKSSESTSGLNLISSDIIPVMDHGGFFEFTPESGHPAPESSESNKNAVIKSKENFNFSGSIRSGSDGSATPSTRSSEHSGSIKVDVGRLDSVVNMVGELVVIKSQLLNASSDYGSDIRLSGICALLDKTVRDLQDRILSMRMTQLRGLFVKMKRLSHDLSATTGKPVNFVMFGEDTEIDRGMVESLADPLLHMIRNSIDHGLEPNSEARAQVGKSAIGHVELAARQVGSRVEIRIQDDGRGLNRERIIAKAIELGWLQSAAAAGSLSDAEIFDFIFRHGFSTAEKLSSLSGRGVGLDVVKTSVERLKGTIQISSKKDIGTTFVISLPLTTAITEGMLVTVSDLHFVLPMDAIREFVQIEPRDVIEIGSTNKAVKIRSRVFPLIYLSDHIDHFQMPGSHLAARPTKGAPTRELGHMVALVETGVHNFGIVLDKIVGHTQVVLKPLDACLQSATILSGAAILGDGRVALVLNVDAIAREGGATNPTEKKMGVAA